MLLPAFPARSLTVGIILLTLHGHGIRASSTRHSGITNAAFARCKCGIYVVQMRHFRGVNTALPIRNQTAYFD